MINLNNRRSRATFRTPLMWGMALCCFLLSAAAALTQTQDDAPVVVGWAEVPPLLSINDLGEPEGLCVDLIERAAEIAGFSYRFQRYNDIPSFFAAQVNGETQVMPCVATLPLLEKTNRFSDPVGQTLIRLFVRADRQNDPEFTEPTGKRIGIAVPSAGSESSALLQRNQQINLPNDSTLLIHLLRGWIDGVVIPQERLMTAAHTIQLDHRIAPVGEVVRTFDRVFSVHESRADLMPRINQAIARMRDSGELDRLGRKWFLTVPPAEPEVLTVAVTDFPPYSTHNDDGTVSGFNVDVMRELAQRANLNIRFQAISDEEFRIGPSAETYDMLAQVGINNARREIMDFTLPIERYELAIFTRTGEAAGLSDLSSLGARRVGVEVTNTARPFAERQGGLDLHVVNGSSALLKALLDGDVDAILFPSHAMRAEIQRQNAASAVQEVAPPFQVIERATALRRGLGQVREKLNDVIPGYVISKEFAALREEYFGEPVFWTRTRIWIASSVVALLLLCLIGYLVWQRQQRRRLAHEQEQQQVAYELQQRALEIEQSHTQELERLVTELERSNRELDEFAYTASHDLKEPLRGIAINANFLAREELTPKGQGRVERMVMLTTRMEQLISDLLYFSRIGRGEKVMKDVDPRHIIGGIEKELTEWLTERKGVIRIVTDLPLIHAERSKVKTVFQNLIVNGLKYNDAGTKTIEIGFDDAVTLKGAIVHNVFWIRDNGIGIEQKNYEKIFRIFQRLNREEDYGAGTGAGLSFVRKIVEEYGCIVEPTSQPGKGSTFYFTLPLADTGS